MSRRVFVLRTPNQPRPPAGGRRSDAGYTQWLLSVCKAQQASILSPATQAELDDIAQELQQQYGADVLILTDDGTGRGPTPLPSTPNWPKQDLGPWMEVGPDTNNVRQWQFIGRPGRSTRKRALVEIKDAAFATLQTTDSAATTLGWAIFDRNPVTSDISTTFGPMTDSWSWSQGWPSAFKLTVSPQSETVHSGTYTTWDHLPFGTSELPKPQELSLLYQIEADGQLTNTWLAIAPNGTTTTQWWMTEESELDNGVFRLKEAVPYVFLKRDPASLDASLFTKLAAVKKDQSSVVTIT